MLSRIKYPSILIGFSLLFWIISQFVLEQPKLIDLEKIAEEVSEEVNEELMEIEALTRDSSWVNKILNTERELEFLPSWYTEKEIFLLYQGNELVRWNNISTLPNAAVLPGSGPQLVQLKNGFYLQVSHGMRDDHILVAMIKVKNQFMLENQYLVNEFAFGLGDIPGITLTKKEVDGSYPVIIAGKALFHLAPETEGGIYKHNDLSAELELLSFLLFIIALFLLYPAIKLPVDPLLKFVAFAVFIALVRYLSLVLDFPGHLDHYDLFSPLIYGTSFVSPSLGDLVINILMAFGLCLIFFSARIKIVPIDSRMARIVFPVAALFGLFLMITEIVNVFRDLVIDSKISFDVIQIVDLNIYSALGFISLGLILYGFYLVSRKVVEQIYKADQRIAFHLLIFGGAIVAYTLVASLSGFEFHHVIILLWMALLYFLFFLFNQKGYNYLAFISIIFWVVFFSAFTAMVLFEYIQEKRDNLKESYINTLDRTGDPFLEAILQNAEEEIKSDVFIKKFGENQYFGIAELSSRIRNLYMRSVSDYQIDVFFVGNDTLAGYQNFVTEEAYADMVNDCKQLSEHGLIFCRNRGPGNYTYYARYEFDSSNDLLLRMKTLEKQKINIYPELLLESSIVDQSEFEKFSYAIYFRDTIVKSDGEVPYSKLLEGYAFKEGERIIKIKEDRFIHFVYRADQDQVIIVSSDKKHFIDLVTFFSYIFFIFLILTALILAVYYTRRVRGRGLRVYLTNSLRNRISFSVLFLVIMPFIIIVVITIIFFTSQYDAYHQERILRKLRSVHNGLEYAFERDQLPLFEFESYEGNLLLERIVNLAEINTMDVNIYSPDGVLKVSSQPEIFNKGLVSRLMNPEALEFLRHNKGEYFRTDESIGRSSYLAVYEPLVTNSGQLKGYLHIPYFAREKELRQEISSFLITLINVYVFLLLASVIITFLVSNSITRSLSVISSKLRNVRLGSRNEPIEWKNKQDEIGMLVDQYNKMIDELQESADKLARSERETAWREMAKQVAHEIKNPLTPMKLSIQHLQRANAEKAPNLEELVQRTTNTLIEQIDNLSRIATEFSSFAQLPKAENAPMNIIDTVRSATDVFENETIPILTDFPEEEIIINADRSKLLRVFNNLLKNAQQAMPEENGEIRVGVYRKDEDRVWITVEDNGVGIPDEMKEQVFVPNFTTKSSGMGIGLAMSKRIVTNAGGDIWFESLEGEGTTFFVELPVYKG